GGARLAPARRLAGALRRGGRGAARAARARAEEQSPVDSAARGGGDCEDPRAQEENGKALHESTSLRQIPHARRPFTEIATGRGAKTHRDTRARVEWKRLHARGLASKRALEISFSHHRSRRRKLPRC